MSDEKEAEYVRIPFANNSLYPMRAGVDEEAFIMLNEILLTRLQGGNDRGKPDWTSLLTTQFQHPVCLKHSPIAG